MQRISRVPTACVRWRLPCSCDGGAETLRHWIVDLFSELAVVEPT